MTSPMTSARFEIKVCRGPECAGKRGADRVHERLESVVRERMPGHRVSLERQSCFGRCTMGPNVYIRVIGEEPAVPRARSILYNYVAEADVDAIVSEHLIGGRIVTHLVGRRAPLASEPPAHAGAGARDDREDDVRLASAFRMMGVPTDD